MVFLSRGLEIMQNYIRTKIFNRNYESYRQQLKMRRDDLLWRGLPRELQSDENRYIMLCFTKRKYYEFTLWNIKSFECYRTEIEKALFLQFHLHAKETSIVRAMSEFFTIDRNTKELLFNATQARQHIEQRIHEMQHSALIKHQHSLMDV